jgi:hypothetical protein
MEKGRTRTGRDEWRKRVERWRESGLSAEAFAAELGTKPATLKFWKYRVGLEAKAKAVAEGKQSSSPAVEAAALVEVRANTSSESAAFVLELGSSRRLQISNAFDDRALARLLAVLERR